MVLFTFAYSAALGGIAGILVAPVLFVSVGMGAVVAAEGVCGEYHRRLWQHSRAPSWAALAIGVAETMGGRPYISVPYKDAFAFALLLLVLLVRPQGLFGERIAEIGVMSAPAIAQARPWRGVLASAGRVGTATARRHRRRRRRATRSTS